MSRSPLVVGAAVVSLVLSVGAVASGFASTTSTSAVSPAATTVRTAGAVDDAIAGFAFAPDPITIKAGQTIRWTNKDSFAHTVKSATFASADLAQGGSYARQFPTAGTFTYLCGIHNSMTGTVIVTP